MFSGAAVADFLCELRAGASPAVAKAASYGEARYRRDLEALTRSLADMGIAPSRRGLDIGCGAGNWAAAFLKGGGKSVVGIDPDAAFVEVAAAVALRFSDSARAEFRVAQAEALPFEDTAFDACWSHGVLMYADLSRALPEIARVLRPGGLFYFSYTLVGGRLKSIAHLLKREDQQGLRTAVYKFHRASLEEFGLYRETKVHHFGAADLVRICAVHGFKLVGRPGVQEQRGDYIGLPLTADFLMRKTDARQAEPEDVDALLRTGCAQRVMSMATSRARRARAILRLGQFEAPEFEDLLAALPRDDRFELSGLRWLARGRPQRAVREFAAIDSAHSGRSFLLGSAHLATREYGSASDAFSASRELRSQAGALLAAIEMGDRTLTARIGAEMAGARGV